MFTNDQQILLVKEPIFRLVRLRKETEKLRRKEEEACLTGVHISLKDIVATNRFNKMKPESEKQKEETYIRCAR